MNFFTRVIKLSIIIIVLSGSINAFAHPIGISVSKIIYSKGKLTFTTRIFYPDFYFEFQQKAVTKNKNYVKAGFNKNDTADISNYFKEHLRIWIGGKEITLTITKLTLENHEDDAFIFVVELNAKAEIHPGSIIKISDTVLLNSIGGQSNIINVFLNNPDSPSHNIITLNKNNPEYEFKTE